jgi:hypothetical protein
MTENVATAIRDYRGPNGEVHELSEQARRL